MKYARRLFVIAGLSLSTLAASNAWAQSAGEKFTRVVEALLDSVDPPDYVSIQGIASGGVSPRGYTSVGLSLSTEDDTRGGNGSVDGSMTLSAGLGELFPGLRSEVSTVLTSVSPTDFGDSASFGVKVGTSIDTLARPISVSLSFDGIGGWGDSEDTELSTTLAASSQATRYFADGSRITYSWSVGGNYTDRDGGEESGFAGVSIGLTPNLSVSTAYDSGSGDTKMGMGLKISDQFTVSATAVDPLNTGDGKGFTFGFGFSALAF